MRQTKSDFLKRFISCVIVLTFLCPNSYAQMDSANTSACLAPPTIFKTPDVWVVARNSGGVIDRAELPIRIEKNEYKTRDKLNIQADRRHQEVIYVVSGSVRVKIAGKEQVVGAGELISTFGNYTAEISAGTRIIRVVEKDEFGLTADVKSNAFMNRVPETVGAQVRWERDSNGNMQFTYLPKTVSPNVFSVVSDGSYKLGIGVKNPKPSVDKIHRYSKAKPEVMIITSGQAKYINYSEDGRKLGERMLNEGDMVLVNSPHSFEFIGNDTRIIVIPVGPFNPKDRKDYYNLNGAREFVSEKLGDTYDANNLTSIWVSLNLEAEDAIPEFRLKRLVVVKKNGVKRYSKGELKDKYSDSDFEKTWNLFQFAGDEEVSLEKIESEMIPLCKSVTVDNRPGEGSLVVMPNDTAHTKDGKPVPANGNVFLDKSNRNLIIYTPHGREEHCGFDQVRGKGLDDSLRDEGMLQGDLSVLIPFGNLYLNEGVIAVCRNKRLYTWGKGNGEGELERREDGKFYSKKGKRYTSLVGRKDGGWSIEELIFEGFNFNRDKGFTGGRVYKMDKGSENKSDVTDLISNAISGPRIVTDGKIDYRVLAAEFNDMNHLFSLPLFRTKKGFPELYFGTKELLDDRRSKGVKAEDTLIYKALNGQSIELGMEELSEFSEDEKNRVFDECGYRAVKEFGIELKQGEYRLLKDRNKIEINLKPGINPLNLVGTDKNGDLIFRTIPGASRISGAALLTAARDMIDKGVIEVLCVSQGKDGMMWQEGKLVASSDSGNKTGTCFVGIKKTKKLAPSEVVGVEASLMSSINSNLDACGFTAGEKQELVSYALGFFNRHKNIFASTVEELLISISDPDSLVLNLRSKGENYRAFVGEERVKLQTIYHEYSEIQRDFVNKMPHVLRKKLYSRKLLHGEMLNSLVNFIEEMQNNENISLTESEREFLNEFKKMHESDKNAIELVDVVDLSSGRGIDIGRVVNKITLKCRDKQMIIYLKGEGRKYAEQRGENYSKYEEFYYKLLQLSALPSIHVKYYKARNKNEYMKGFSLLQEIPAVDFREILDMGSGKEVTLKQDYQKYGHEILAQLARGAACADLVQKSDRTVVQRLSQYGTNCMINVRKLLTGEAEIYSIDQDWIFGDGESYILQNIRDFCNNEWGFLLALPEFLKDRDKLIEEYTRAYLKMWEEIKGKREAILEMTIEYFGKDSREYAICKRKLDVDPKIFLFKCVEVFNEYLGENKISPLAVNIEGRMRQVLDIMSSENLAAMFGVRNINEIPDDPVEIKKVLIKNMAKPLEEFFRALIAVEGKTESTHLEPMIEHYICFFTALIQLAKGKLPYAEDPNQQHQLLRLCEGSSEARFINNANILYEFYNNEYIKWVTAILLHDIGKFRDPANHNLESFKQIDEFELFEVVDNWTKSIGANLLDEYTKNRIKLAVKYHTHLGLIGSGQWTVRIMAEILNDELLKSMTEGKSHIERIEIIKQVLNDIALITLLDVSAYTLRAVGEKGYKKTPRKPGFLRTPVIDLYTEVVNSIITGLNAGKNVTVILDTMAREMGLVKIAIGIALYDKNLSKHFSETGSLEQKYAFYIDKFMKAKDEAIKKGIVSEEDWQKILDFLTNQNTMGWMDIFVALAWLDKGSNSIKMKNIGKQTKVNLDVFKYLKFIVKIKGQFPEKIFKKVIVYGRPNEWFNRSPNQIGMMNRLLDVIDRFSKLTQVGNENKYYLADADGNRIGTGCVEIRGDGLVFVIEDKSVKGVISPKEINLADAIELQDIRLAEYDSTYRHTRNVLSLLKGSNVKKFLDLLRRLSFDKQVRDGIKYIYIDPLVSVPQLEEFMAKGSSSHIDVRIVNGETINIERVDVYLPEMGLIERLLSYPQRKIVSYKYRDASNAMGFEKIPVPDGAIAPPWYTEESGANTIYAIMTLMLSGAIREAAQLGVELSFNLGGSYEMGTPGINSDIDFHQICLQSSKGMNFAKVVYKRLFDIWEQSKQDMTHKRIGMDGYTPFVEGAGYFDKNKTEQVLRPIFSLWREWLVSQNMSADVALLDQCLPPTDEQTAGSVALLATVNQKIMEKIAGRMQSVRQAGKYNVGIVAMEMPLSDMKGNRLKSAGGRGGGQGVYMGDVPWAVSQNGIGAFVFKPLFSADVKATYGSIEKFLQAYNGTPFMDIDIPVGGGTVKLDVIYIEQEGVPVFLLYDPSENFFRELYGDTETVRGYIEAILLPRAPLVLMEKLGIQFEVLHFNDWQTALGPIFLKELYKDKKWPLGHPPAALFTTHNLEYQGLFPREMTVSRDDPFVKYLLDRDILRLSSEPRNQLPNAYPEGSNIRVDLFMLTNLDRKIQYIPDGGLEFWSKYPGGYIKGRHNLMKGAFLYSDRILFVSEGHLKEAVTHARGYGLDGVLRGIRNKLAAVYNGIRADKHRPEKLKALKVDGFTGAPVNGDLVGWKEHNKKALQDKVKLDDPNPKNFILSIVTRIVKQKGLNVLLTPLEKDGPLLIDALLSISDPSTGAKLQFIIQGTASDPRGKRVAELLREKAKDPRFKDNFRFIEEFDPILAKQIGAGSQAGLMPSIDEPGGLANQEMALLLTALVVTNRGGLNDFYEAGATPVKPVPGFEIDDDEASVAERMVSAKAIYDAVYGLFDMYINRPSEYKQMLEKIAQFNPDWGERVGMYDKAYSGALRDVRRRTLGEDVDARAVRESV